MLSIISSDFWLVLISDMRTLCMYHHYIVSLVLPYMCQSIKGGFNHTVKQFSDISVGQVESVDGYCYSYRFMNSLCNCKPSKFNSRCHLRVVS